MAVDCYLRAVEFNSTYSLAIANMGYCYLKLEKYKEALNAFARVEEVLPNDNNSLSSSNRSFVQGVINMLKQEGDMWKKTGFID